MSEYKETLPNSDITIANEESAAETYFMDLGLSWSDLIGKDVLDIGAGDADFAKAAKRRGVQVVSVDIIPGGMGNNGEVPLGIPYVVADFTQGLELPPESFDLLVARASVHSMVEVEEDLVAVIKEAKRLLKPGGEFRFTSPGRLRPVRMSEREKWFELLDRALDNKPVSEEEEAWGEKVWPRYKKEQEQSETLERMTDDERVAFIKRSALEDLYRIEPSITVHSFTRVLTWKGKVENIPSDYCKLVKTENLESV